MLEILFLFFYTRKIGRILEARGIKAGGYKLLAVILWFEGEFLGAFIASACGVTGYAIYPAGLGGAIIGAIVTYLIVAARAPAAEAVRFSYGKAISIAALLPLLFVSFFDWSSACWRHGYSCIEAVSAWSHGVGPLFGALLIVTLIVVTISFLIDLSVIRVRLSNLPISYSQISAALVGLTVLFGFIRFFQKPGAREFIAGHGPWWENVRVNVFSSNLRDIFAAVTIGHSSWGWAGFALMIALVIGAAITLIEGTRVGSLIGAHLANSVVPRAAPTTAETGVPSPQQVGIVQASIARGFLLGSSLLLLVFSFLSWNIGGIIYHNTTARVTSIHDGVATVIYTMRPPTYLHAPDAWYTGRGEAMGIALVLLLLWETVLLLKAVLPKKLKLLALPFAPALISMVLVAITIDLGLLRLFQPVDGLGSRTWEAWTSLLLILPITVGAFLGFQQDQAAQSTPAARPAPAPEVLPAE